MAKRYIKTRTLALHPRPDDDVSVTPEESAAEQWLREPLTRAEFRDFAVALLVALDENKALSLDAVYQSFTDTITRRIVDSGETGAETFYLQAWLTAISQIERVKKPPKDAPT